MDAINVAIICNHQGNWIRKTKPLNSSESVVNPAVGIDRIGDHKIIKISYLELYKLHGPSKTMKKINDILCENMVGIVVYFCDEKLPFPIEYFSELRRSYFIAMYTGDDEHNFDKSVKYYSQACDLMLTDNCFLEKRYELYGVDAITFPVFPGFYYAPQINNHKVEKIYDVCFFGDVNNKVGRKEFLTHLIKNNINIKIYGPGTLAGVVSLDEMIRIIRSSKIALNLSGLAKTSALDTDLTINWRMRGTKGRIYDNSLLGTFLLTEVSPGIEEFFDVGNEIDIFRDQDELLEKVRFYLKNDVLREEMAIRGYERAFREYDDVRGWKKFFNLVDHKIEAKNKKTSSFKDIIYKDPVFKRVYSSFHLFQMIKVLMKGNFGQALEEFLIFIKYPLIDCGSFSFHIKNDLTGFMGGIKWLRILVRKLRKYKNNVNEI